MFTGIVEEMGRVEAIDLGQESARIRIRAQKALADVTQGASISVDGCCLTAVAFTDEWFEADVMLETLKRTTLGDRGMGDPVNLERPVGGVGRLGGHVVQGHVDGVGRIVSRLPGDRWEIVEIEVDRSLARYLVEKGSVAIDGVSLTIVEVSPANDPRAWFTVSLIPETLAVTTLGAKSVGSPVNLEVDVLAKYVERLLAFAGEQS
jgi:riboflavin synthase